MKLPGLNKEVLGKNVEEPENNVEVPGKMM